MAAPPAGQQPRAHHQSPVFPLPASCFLLLVEWTDARSLGLLPPSRPVPFQCSTPSTAKPTHPASPSSVLSSPESANSSRKSVPAPRPARRSARRRRLSRRESGKARVSRRRGRYFLRGLLPTYPLLPLHLQAAARRSEPSPGIVPRRGSGLIRPRVDRLGGAGRGGAEIDRRSQRVGA